jgi:hypothetical protein
MVSAQGVSDGHSHEGPGESAFKRGSVFEACASPSGGRCGQEGNAILAVLERMIGDRPLSQSLRSLRDAFAIDPDVPS